MTGVLALALLLLADPAMAEPTPTPVVEATPSPTPEATPVATPLPVAAPLDPRLFDPATETVSPAGPLLTGPDLDRKDPHGIPPRLGPAIGIPTGSLLLVSGTWAGIAGRTGDSGTPLFEIGAGWGAGMVGATVSTLASVVILQPKEASPAVLAIPAVATPIAAGLGTWAVAQKLEGRAEHEDEVLAGAIAGAFAGEAIFAGSIVLSRGVVGGATWLTFVPIGAGATLGYRLARGESGRSSPLWRAPVTLTVVF